jgi:hypothetical protein
METRYKIFTGLWQGTVKVLRDPEAKPQQGEGQLWNQHPQRLLPRMGMTRCGEKKTERGGRNGYRHKLKHQAYSCGPECPSEKNMV